MATFEPSLYQRHITQQLLRYVFLSLCLCVTSSSDVIVSPLPLPPDMRSPQQLDNQYKNDVNSHHKAVSYDHREAQGNQPYLSNSKGQQQGTQVIIEHSRNGLPWNHNVIQDIHPNRYSDKLNITLVESSTSYLEIRWRLQNSTGSFLGVYPKFTRVRCDLGNTTILHHIYGARSHFRIENLVSNTRYTVCVETVPETPVAPGTPAAPHRGSASYLGEEVVPDMQDVVHYRCELFSTIPIVRIDSIVGLLLTLGYIFMMAVIGYVTWSMRVRKLTSNRRKSHNEIEMSCRTSTVKCSDIEDQVQLPSNTHEHSNSH